MAGEAAVAADAVCASLRVPLAFLDIDSWDTETLSLERLWRCTSRLGMAVSEGKRSLATWPCTSGMRHVRDGDSVLGTVVRLQAPSRNVCVTG